MLYFILLIILIVVICLHLIKPNEHWKKKGILYLKPWPLFGNLGASAFGKRNIALVLEDVYKMFSTERYVGIYQFSQPVLLVCDPDLIKKITIKEADVFPDHKILTASSKDVFTKKNLFNLTAAKGWHDLRSVLSPAFTTSKMKMMFVLIEQCAQQFTSFFQKQAANTSVELKAVYSKFSIDVIGTTMFGVACDSLKNPENQIYLTGRNMSKISFFKSLKFFASTFSPILTELLEVSLFGKDAVEFFRRLIKETIRVRKEKQIVRQDLLHLLMEAKKGRLIQDEVGVSSYAIINGPEVQKTHSKPKTELSNDDIAFQILIFFFAGFDTVSTLMCYLTYELAVNIDVQEKLLEEIKATLKNCNGTITYESLLEMKYLDCVILEALRKWPPAVYIDRVSVKPFTIEPERPGQKPLHLEAGSILWIPIYAIHRDPKYYPDPEKFDPERFNDVNKQNIKPCSYLPFGSGPRSCIGSRFALLEMKLLVVNFLQKFEFVPVSKTPARIKLVENRFNFLPCDDIWMGFKLRNDS